MSNFSFIPPDKSKLATTAKEAERYVSTARHKREKRNNWFDIS